MVRLRDGFDSFVFFIVFLNAGFLLPSPAEKPVVSVGSSFQRR